ncbi:MAG: HAD hydrolase family protein [Sulfurimonas sp.]|nr:HAD hydrolase family protein [Sulfurimonas sp.]
MIKLLVLDVDGCLTDGSIVYSENGDEIKHFNVKDGLAITSWIRLGNEVAIITGRKSGIVSKRAKELGVQHLFQGIKNKDVILKDLLASLSLESSQVAAIGDDLNDFKMLQSVAQSFTPQNGVTEIKEIVDTILSKNGGDGAVREMVDILIASNGQKKEFMALWI